MPGSIPAGADIGLYVPTTRIINTGIDLDKKGLLFVMTNITRDINYMSLALNAKNSGYYVLTEFLDGNQWFNLTTTDQSSSRVYRGEFRCVVNFGALPNATSATVAHGLDTTNWIVTKIYGAATDPTGSNFIPIPYASPTLNQNISIAVDATNVTITTGIDRTAFTTTYVVLEYLK